VAKVLVSIPTLFIYHLCTTNWSNVIVHVIALLKKSRRCKGPKWSKVGQVH